MAKAKKAKTISKKALAEVNKMAVGDRLLAIFDLLKNLDFAKLGEIATLATQLASAKDLKTRIKLALQLAALGTSLTPGDADDKAVAMVASVLANEVVLDTLVVIVARLLGPRAASLKASAFKDLSIHATGIDIVRLLKLAKMVATLLAVLLKDSVAMDGVFRNPAVIYHPGIFSAKDLAEKVDWGLQNHNIPKTQKLAKGSGIKIGICDTGKPAHLDIGDLAFAYNFSGSDSADDHDGHGTHVAGIVRALENGVGVVGVAPKAQIGTCKVLDDNGMGTNRGVVKGIKACIDEGCDIISMSLGGNYDKGIAKACDEAVAKGIHVICAVGNDGNEHKDNINYPAKLPSTIAITSYNQAGNISEFSSRGAEVDFAFPGERILSTWLKNKYKVLSGSSMATPFGSGVVALLLSYLKKKNATLPKTPDELRALLKSYCDDKGTVGKDTDWGFGIPNLHKLITKPIHAKAAGGLFQVDYPAIYQGRTGIFISLTE